MTDDPAAERARFGVLRAIATRLTRDAWTRTHCTHTLAHGGRGVAHNPACNQGPIRIRWSGRARDALPDLRNR
jgi:hypothetical protein